MAYVRDDKTWVDGEPPSGMNCTSYFSRRRSVLGIAKRQGCLCGYVLDGLLHNKVVESDIRSTDMHGYTEVILALTYLLGIQFAPHPGISG